MSLDLFNNLINKAKESDFVQNFITELTKHLENKNKKEGNELDNKEKNSELNYRKEDCLYLVVDFSSDGVFLQNTDNDVIFEEKNITQELLDKIGSDYILRFKDGNYIIEEELTDDFMNSMVDVKEYQKIKEDFKQESNILENDPDTNYTLKSRDEYYATLNYGENNENTMKVPNVLIPYFAKEGNSLQYKNGKFERNM